MMRKIVVILVCMSNLTLLPAQFASDCANTRLYRNSPRPSRKSKCLCTDKQSIKQVRSRARLAANTALANTSALAQAQKPASKIWWADPVIEKKGATYKLFNSSFDHITFIDAQRAVLLHRKEKRTKPIIILSILSTDQHHAAQDARQRFVTYQDGQSHFIIEYTTDDEVA